MNGEPVREEWREQRRRELERAIQLEKEKVPFLKMIRERPTDPGPIRVYADWLEERGEVEHALYLRSVADFRESCMRTGAPEKFHRDLLDAALRGRAVISRGVTREMVRLWMLEFQGD